MNHHPSCKSDDKALVLKCSQCGMEEPSDLDARISKAIDLAVQWGGIDGGHHKTWVIDQMVRALAGPDYDRVVARCVLR